MIVSARNLVAALLVMVCVGGGVATAQTATTAVSGDAVTIGVGSRDGVRVGMTGRISKQEMVGGQLQSFEIARFRVTEVGSASCSARLTDVGEGWRVESGMGVAFDQPLMPPQPSVRPTPRPPAATPTPRLPSDPAELDRMATAAFEAGRWAQAIELYQSLLKVVPNEPLAKKRLQESETKLQAERQSADEAARRAAEDARRREELKAKLTNADYLMGKGDQLMEEGEWTLAAEYYRQVADVDRSFREAGARQLLAECRAALAAKDHAEARLAYDRLKALTLPVDLAAQVSQLDELMLLLPGAEWTDPAIGMKFRYIPAGSFEMGSPASEAGRGSDERQHRVTLTRGYWMGETEVTQGQWRAVMGSNPSEFSNCGDNCPVESVSWLDTVAFANSMSRNAGLQECFEVDGESVDFLGPSCSGFRLPTEAEWEYAARSMASHRYGAGDELSAVGWYAGNSGNRSHLVGQKLANAWSLHDMPGSVWEWVWDWHADYPSEAVTDPLGPPSGSSRIIRGGSWLYVAELCRPTFRSALSPGQALPDVGLRLARTAQ